MKIKNLKQRSLSLATALVLGTSSYVMINPTNAYAATHKWGVTVDENTEEEFNTYVVEEGDNASRISTKIVNYFRKNKEVPKDDMDALDAEPNTSCKYWPVVAYYNTNNGRKFHIEPGDVIKFPKTYEELKEAYRYVKNSGWYANYCDKNKVYEPTKVFEIPMEETRRLIEEVYSYTYPDEYIDVDYDFVETYLRAHGYNGKYVFKEGSKLDNKEIYGLTEWIPTIEQLEEYKPKKKTR